MTKVALSGGLVDDQAMNTSGHAHGRARRPTRTRGRSVAEAAATLLLVSLVCGCGKEKGADAGSERPATAPDPLALSASSASSAPVASLSPTAPSSATSTAAPSRKKHRRVLHTGDSMVGGGLARALGPKFEADGAKYRRDVVESGTIHDFAQNDHLPTLIASFKPDLVLITLGANHIPNSVDPEKEIGPFLPKLLKRLRGVDCYWIAPPIWKPEQAKFNRWLGEHVAPCRFYDASPLEIARRPDKIHPTDQGGETWAEGVWAYLEGEGAFLDGRSDGGAQ